MKTKPSLSDLCSSVFIGGFCFVFSVSLLAAAPQRVEVSRDCWISAYGKEREGNNGASPKLKLKSIQEMFLIDFDPAPYKGRRVARAALHLHVLPPIFLGRVTVSALADPWSEGDGKSYALVPGASSFEWAATNQKRWGGNAGDAPDITAVVLGGGGTRWGFADATPPDAQGWQVIAIDPAVVQDRIDGRSFGFFVMDDVGSEYTRTGNQFEYRPLLNRYVHSREGPRKTAPYFTLEFTDAPVAPAPPSNVSSPSPSKPVKSALLPQIPAAPTADAPPVACRSAFGEPLNHLAFFAARNEAIGFLIESDPKQIALAAPPGIECSLFAAPKVAGRIDPLVPIARSAAPADAAFIEIYVPHSAPPGLHAGSLNIAGRQFPFTLTVWSFTLPDHLSFIPQMNAYDLPERETGYYQLAHEHRTTLNRLRYGWTGKVSPEDVPRRNADGSWDWSRFDRRFGPLLDGSAFAGSRRKNIPVDAFYLPLNENWPMDHPKHFKGGYWIETAYDESYWSEFRAAAAEFARHIAEKNWTHPVFEFFLNNKVYFKHERGDRWDACSAPWIFDEPMHTQDFWALRRFGMEFWKGVAAPGIPEDRAPHLAFRIDISRPQWQRDLLDGIDSVQVVSGSMRTYHQSIADRARRFKNLVYMYGSPNPIGSSNAIPACWCVETWALGADGVVPWQTLGRASSWVKPDPLAMFYPTEQGPIPSIRLKSFRAGQQLVEYLTIYTALTKQDRAAVGSAVLTDPAFGGLMEKKSETDAGNSSFSPDSAAAFESLRLRLGAWLSEKSPPPQTRWHDPRPPIRDPNLVREIHPVAAK